MNKVYEKITLSLIEGLMTGASPTKTGAMAGRFLARQRAIGASPEHQSNKAKQAYRIRHKTGERQRQVADRSGILHKQTGDRVAQAAKDRFAGAEAAGEGYPGGRKGSSVHQWIPDRAPKVPTDQRRQQNEGLNMNKVYEKITLSLIEAAKRKGKILPGPGSEGSKKKRKKGSEEGHPILGDIFKDMGSTFDMKKELDKLSIRKLPKDKK